MQKAVVDIGNTKTKIFLFNNSELLEQWSFDLEVKVDLSAYIAEEIPLIISAV
jgi:pantothenate kinase type III